MPAPPYPPGTVRALLGTRHVSPQTRAALEARLAHVPDAPRFFDHAEYGALVAVCARLVPQPHRDPPIPVAALIDERLAAGDGNGWRYDALPPDGAAYRRGLAALDATGRERHGAPFADLDGTKQDVVLGAVQRGEADGDFAAARWFEELLADACESFYSHPLAQEEIGYAGFADAPRWDRIGLGEREPREPQPTDA